MFLPNLPQKDYFCFKDANKGNCFHKERAGKTTPDPSFGFPPILNVLKLKSNPKYLIKHTVVWTARSLGAVLHHVPVPPHHWAKATIKKKQQNSPKHLSSVVFGSRWWLAVGRGWGSLLLVGRDPRWQGASLDLISGGLVPFCASNGTRIVLFPFFFFFSLPQIPFVQS